MFLSSSSMTRSFTSRMMATRRGREFLDKLHQAPIEGGDDESTACCSYSDSDDDDSMFDEEDYSGHDGMSDEAFAVTIDGYHDLQELCVGDDHSGCCEAAMMVSDDKEDIFVPLSDTPSSKRLLSRYANDLERSELLLDDFERRLENEMQVQRLCEGGGESSDEEEDGGGNSSDYNTPL